MTEAQQPVMRESTKPFLSYLPLYNLFSTIGWGCVLCSVLLQYPRIGQPEYYWCTKNTVTVVQCCAILEIFNALIGIVRSPILTTAAQVASRLLVVLGVFQLLPDASAAQGIPYVTLLTAWSLAEVVRYLFYFFTLTRAQGAPRVLHYMRYNLFIVLYPTGVASELIIIHSALPLALDFYPVWFHRLLIASMLTYVPGLPMLFVHMLAQRKKALRKLEETDKKINYC